MPGSLPHGATTRRPPGHLMVALFLALALLQALPCRAAGERVDADSTEVTIEILEAEDPAPEAQPPAGTQPSL